MSKIDELRAKAAAKVKEAIAAFGGRGGVFAKLKRDHAEVLEMMKAVIEAGDDVQPRRELYPELKVALLAHTRAEQQEFYSVLSQHDQLRPHAEQGQRDHEKIEQIFDQLDSLNESDPQWLTTFKELQSNVVQHVQWEENQVSKAVQDVLTDDQIKEMGEKFESAERDFEQRIKSGERPPTPPEPPQPAA